jgi:hypothetical protein
MGVLMLFIPKLTLERLQFSLSLGTFQSRSRDLHITHLAAAAPHVPGLKVMWHVLDNGPLGRRLMIASEMDRAIAALRSSLNLLTGFYRGQWDINSLSHRFL